MKKGMSVPPVEIIKSMGLVFGDIGTSPIYTLTVLFIFIIPTLENILGVLSLITWTLILLVTVQYAFLAMQLDHNGEGGTIVLKETLLQLTKTAKGATIVSLLAVAGVSLMIGDCVITPAISILSAVEGFRLIPAFSDVSQSLLLIVAAIITIALFFFQRRGSERVAKTFAPVMLVWFSVLAITGAVSLLNSPGIIVALNPMYAIHFLISNGIISFFILSDVILCATGGEALYADMGHLGKEPIRRAWFFVFIALILSYLGQGAFLLTHIGTKNVLFGMVNTEFQLIYIPFLILAIISTVIASQAVISGIFSVVYQAITTHMLPPLKIDYTSIVMRNQIYINFVNWMLCISVLLVLFLFEYSERLASAYGLAVTGTMLITGILMTVIFFKRHQYFRSSLAFFTTIIDFSFFFACLSKIPHGAYLSLIIAAIPFGVIIIYINGQKRLYEKLHLMEYDEFIKRYNKSYAENQKISGTALFFARDRQRVPAYITHTIFNNTIIYEKNILISIEILRSPFGLNWDFRQNEIGTGLYVFTIRYGYMEVIDLMEIIRNAEIHEKTIFYGMEEIVTDNLVWKIFYGIKKICPSFVEYYKLPPHKIHGVVTRVEM